MPVLPGRAPHCPGAEAGAAQAQGPACARPHDRQLLDALARYGDARGWASETMRRARRALTAVLASGQDFSQRPWDAELIRRFLNERHLVALRVVEFLTDEGLARANPQAALDRWLTSRLATLSGPFAAEVRIWTEALQGRGPVHRAPGTEERSRRICGSLRCPWAHGRRAMSRCARSPPMI